jgi:hypothetical protein
MAPAKTPTQSRTRSSAKESAASKKSASKKSAASKKTSAARAPAKRTKTDAARRPQQRATAREMARAVETASAGVTRSKKRPPVSAARGAEKPSNVNATCDAIEVYLDALLSTPIEGLEVEAVIVPPQKPAAIAGAEEKLGAPFPSDVKDFLLRGLRAPRGGTDEPFAAMGFDFLGANGIVKSTALLRKIANEGVEDGDEDEDEDAHAALVDRGIVLTSSEPYLVVASDGVYHFSFRNPLLRVASSWSELLEHWLGSGCFSSHSFDALWARVNARVVHPIAPAKNVWVRAYKKQFPTLG